MVSAHKCAERIFTQCTVVAGHVQQIIAFAYIGCIAFAVGNGRKFHIGADKAAEDSSGRRHGKAGLRKQRLLLLRQHMRSKAQQVGKIKLKFVKRRLCQAGF